MKASRMHRAAQRRPNKELNPTSLAAEFVKGVWPPIILLSAWAAASVGGRLVRMPLGAHSSRTRRWQMSKRTAVRLALSSTALCAFSIAGCQKQVTGDRYGDDTAQISGVAVARLTDSEVDRLPTLSKLSAEACSETTKGKSCLISRDVDLKWGWGFCDNDAESLQSGVRAARVELIVDDVRIPSDLIYERDETYDRVQNAFCHVWLVKLTEWESGATVRLENWATTPSLGEQDNLFVVNVK
ncbi:MAG: hypothetical protein A2Z21_05820 [Candidatus Fraserbacteria bacterium RBG_16_55_9]|uniref:Uncharacterized protein n=1 Tax=Fraserbacteria sp. (strain RBG_16_55_9) TaxID=1817864 RepID=A0A1F5V2A3_FRAXR|nr:MAG: hypothetical protein A2Z21_05820 [Candidatus Fraserbacteria bacterium RBG_16_55_9]